jgi:hypothetical protein
MGGGDVSDREHHRITLDGLERLLDSQDGALVSVGVGVEHSMSGTEGMSAYGRLTRRRGGIYDPEPGLPKVLTYDLRCGGDGVAWFHVDELYFAEAELIVFHTGQDCPRLFITQDVWRLDETGELPSARLRLYVYFEDVLTLEPPSREEVAT